MDAKDYNPDTDRPGTAIVPIGQKVEQVLNGGHGSGNFGHAGRKGEVGGSEATGYVTLNPGHLEAGVAERLRTEFGRKEGGSGGVVAFRSGTEVEATLNANRYALISAGKNSAMETDPRTSNKYETRNAALKAELDAKGYQYTPCVGKYGDREDSFLVMVHDADVNDVLGMGTKYGQQSVIVANHGTQYQVYTNPTPNSDNPDRPYKVGDYVEGKGFTNVIGESKDFYTKVPIGTAGPGKFGTAAKFSLNFDFEHVKSGFTHQLVQKEPVGR